MPRVVPNFVGALVKPKLSNGDDNFGLFAVSDIKAETEILNIHLKDLILSPYRFDKFVGKSYLLGLIVRAYQLLLCGDDSDYVSTLPVHCKLPYQWPFSLRSLMSPTTKNRILEIREQVSYLFSVALNKSLLGSVISYERFQVAFFLVNTRCVMLPETTFPCQAALVPYFDLLNHDSTIQCALKFNHKRSLLQLSTDKFFKAGEEVFINYGPHSNETLLCEYGFVEIKNPNDSVIVGDESIILVCSEIYSLPESRVSSFLTETKECRYGDFTFGWNGVSWCLSKFIMFVENAASEQCISILEFFTNNNTLGSDKYYGLLGRLIQYYRKESRDKITLCKVFANRRRWKKNTQVQDYLSILDTYWSEQLKILDYCLKELSLEQKDAT